MSRLLERFDAPQEAEPSFGGAPGAVRRAPRITLAWLFTLACAVAGYQIGLRRLHDNSFFVHLTTGRYILDHGIPHHDVYSFTAAGHSFTAQSWLAETAYGVLDRTTGPIGIRVLMGLTAALLCAGLYRMALRFARDRVRAAGVTLASFGTVAGIYSERPLAFGLLALVGVLFCVEVPESRLGRRPEIALPVLMWLWGNVHGSMALGYVYLALHLLARWLDGAVPWRAERERKLLTGTAISLVVLLANPYGPTLLLFPLDLVRRGNVLRDVVEWMSPDFHSGAGMAFGATLLVTLAVFALGRQRPTRRDVIVTVPFLLLGLWALRNVAIAAMIVLPALARASAAENERPEPEGRQLRLVMGVGLVSLAALFTVQALGVSSYQLDGYSVRAMRALDAKGLLGRRLLTTDANAGYVLASRWPTQRVYMDDRYDMYPEAVVRDYTAMSRGEPSWSRLLDKYRIEIVLWPAERTLTQLVAGDRRWHVVYRDKHWVAFARS